MRKRPMVAHCLLTTLYLMDVSAWTTTTTSTGRIEVPVGDDASRSIATGRRTQNCLRHLLHLRSDSYHGQFQPQLQQCNGQSRCLQGRHYGSRCGSHQQQQQEQQQAHGYSGSRGGQYYCAADGACDDVIHQHVRLSDCICDSDTVEKSVLLPLSPQIKHHHHVYGKQQQQHKIESESANIHSKEQTEVSSRTVTSSLLLKSMEMMASPVSRQQLMTTALASLTPLAVLMSLSLPAVAEDLQLQLQRPQQRVKGAAELDIDYYFKDLIRGNVPDPSSRPEQLKAARLLDSALVMSFSNILIKQITRFAEGSKSEKDVKALLDTTVTRYGPAFQRKQYFPLDDFTNQYCFDMWSYCAFKVAAKLIPDFSRRAAFVWAVGADTFALMQSRLGGKLKFVDVLSSNEGNTVADALKGVDVILEDLKRASFIRDYSWSQRDVGGIDADYWVESKENHPISITTSGGSHSTPSSGPVGLGGLVVEFSVFEPATLGAFVQLTGESQRFHPDFVGPTVQAYLAKCNLRGAYDEYFLDATYRPDPTQYVASEVVYNWELV